MKKSLAQKMGMLGLFLMVKGMSYATSTDPSLLYESFVQKMLKSIEGPVAVGLGTILIIVSGLSWAFGQNAEGGMKIVFKVGFVLSLAFGASALVKGLGGSSIILKEI